MSFYLCKGMREKYTFIRYTFIPPSGSTKPVKPSASLGFYRVLWPLGWNKRISNDSIWKSLNVLHCNERWLHAFLIIILRFKMKFTWYVYYFMLSIDTKSVLDYFYKEIPSVDQKGNENCAFVLFFFYLMYFFIWISKSLICNTIIIFL